VTGRERWKAIGAWTKTTLKAWAADLRDDWRPHVVSMLFGVALFYSVKLALGFLLA
jgi:hypothetical protein